MNTPAFIHPTAIVSPKAKLGKNVTIGQFTTIYDNVTLGDDCEVGGYCELGVPNKFSRGEPLVIGSGALIRSHSIFYEASSFGERLVTGHRVTVREKTIAGVNLQVGTLTDIQGSCRIGDYVRMHSNVHVGQHSTIGDYVWIFPYVVLTNDPHPPSDVMRGVTIEDYAVIATMTTVLPGVKVGKHALVGAHSLLGGDALPGKIYAGKAAEERGEVSAIRLKDGTRRPAYPWIKHFRRGYPATVVEQWEKMINEGLV
jgi:acyl-[acyl carrier protein]--UDP-N-acetylglucosamine O-acyltransferase